jgi:hypothetical protein
MPVQSSVKEGYDALPATRTWRTLMILEKLEADL